MARPWFVGSPRRELLDLYGASQLVLRSRLGSGDVAETRNVEY